MKQIFTILLLFSVLFLNAQTQISGKIISTTGEPLFGVNISTDRLEGTVSDFDGNYVLDLKPGTITLKLSSIGFVSQQHQVTIAENKKLVLNYTLVEEEIKVNDIIVYGSKRGKKIQEEVQSVEVIQAELLENNNVTDGLKAVSLLSGVTVLDGQMSIRGGSGYAYGVGSRVILVQDEVPILTPERDEINWDFIPTENIEQLELIKGGGAVQYGSSALNGILNVRSAWAKKKQESEITVYGTLMGQPKIKAANWWKDESSFFNMPHTLGLTFTHRRKMKHNVDVSFSGMGHSYQSHLKDEFNERARLNFNIRHRSEKVDGLSFGLYTMYMYKNDSFFFIWDDNDDKKYLPLATYGKRFHYTMFHPFVSYYDKKGNTYKYNGSVYYDKNASKGSLTSSVKVYNDFQYKKEFKFNLDLIAGLTAENYFVRATALRDVFFPNDEEGWFSGGKYAAYILADYKYKGLNVSGGARYEVINLDKKVLSSKPTFNLGASYEITKNDFIRISFAQAFRLPSIAERYVDESLGPINIYPNVDIRPETGYTSEIGYKRMLNNKKWQGFVDFAVYWTEFNEMIEFNFADHSADAGLPPGSQVGFKAVNIARARIFGWEFNLEEKGSIGKVDLQAKFGYTYAYAGDLNANPKLKNIGTFIGNAFKAIYVTDEQHKFFEANSSGSGPNNPLYGILRYRFRHTLKMDLNAEYRRFGLGVNMAYYSYLDNVDEVFKLLIPGVAEDRAKENYTGEFILNLRAMYNVQDKVSFSFIVENVLNNDYALRPSKPNAPRSFTFQTKLKF